MKKIPWRFKRDCNGYWQLYDEVVPGCEWVVEGEGVATVAYDGKACMVRDGVLFKRHDRKLKKGKRKAAPEGWEPCEDAPNEHTGQWPGWVPVGDGPEDKCYRDALSECIDGDGTYELVGPGVRGNPHWQTFHQLWRHGSPDVYPPRAFAKLRAWLGYYRYVKSIVWHHPDGRMCKVKRKDFGLPWPPIPEVGP